MAAALPRDGGRRDAVEVEQRHVELRVEHEKRLAARPRAARPLRAAAPRAWEAARLGEGRADTVRPALAHPLLHSVAERPSRAGARAGAGGRSPFRRPPSLMCLCENEAPSSCERGATEGADGQLAPGRGAGLRFARRCQYRCLHGVPKQNKTTYLSVGGVITLLSSTEFCLF